MAALEVNQGGLAWLNQDGNRYRAITIGTGDNTVGAGAQLHPDRSLGQLAGVVAHLFKQVRTIGSVNPVIGVTLSVGGGIEIGAGIERRIDQE